MPAGGVSGGEKSFWANRKPGGFEQARAAPDSHLLPAEAQSRFSETKFVVVLSGKKNDFDTATLDVATMAPHHRGALGGLPCGQNPVLLSG